MEQNKLDRETFSCSICLDLLKDPVTIPCGHSYCMNCIKRHWNVEDLKRIYSCPQCREKFSPRPALKKNVVFATVVEDLKNTGLQAAPADHRYAGPKDVACDFCTGTKLKATKSCLVCLASYCEKHLQPHYNSDTFKQHHLVEPTKNLKKNICSKHDHVMKIFCRTDQKCICSFCLMDEHQGHNTVSASVEWTERQRELKKRRGSIKQRLQVREEDVKLLQQEVEDINHSADKAVEECEEIFTELIRLLQKRSSDVKQQIRFQQETEVRQVKDVQEKLQQEITELKRKNAELKELSKIEDHNQFLCGYSSMPVFSESTNSSSININPLRYFEDILASVSELQVELQDILRDPWRGSLLSLTEVNVSLSEQEPKSRAGFLRHSKDLTLNPNTANVWLALSKEDRKVKRMGEPQFLSRHAERFTHWRQVLSRESLTGCCYWEVERKGRIYVAVAYNSIIRAGRSNKSLFGANDKSWALECRSHNFKFGHNDIWKSISGPVSSRVGVYLDHRAGILSFYRVSESMTLIHRVQTTFTEPLHAGLWIGFACHAELCEPK
ncbi:tripartite motif-containing protein 16-like [Poeciliopsis prolifica]|uniref:tripartite motif-containing protein 16-like n=1 Tax=Poeciliopsis prolifica TaxID=188132 RepID=UPI0024145B60|nr:tripartite motif-containing protein 16-like [Poeciliopsis prolifica]